MKKCVRPVPSLIFAFLCAALLLCACTAARPAAPSAAPLATPSAAPTAEPVFGEIVLVQPTERERMIAPGRDFYVIAALDAAPETEVTAQVTLTDASGKVVRRVQSGLTDFRTDYELLEAYHTEQSEWLMPELLFDPAEPESFGYAWNKCYVKDGYIAAYVCGGGYQGHVAHTGEDGAPLAPLAAGSYTLSVTADAGLAAYKGEWELTVGTTADKTMGRFSPSAHWTAMTAAAAQEGYRVYEDALPGYWTPSRLFAPAKDSEYFAEIKPCWQYADGCEYRAGRVHLYLYNISSTCATQTVEMGVLQAEDAFRTGRLTMYRYDIGEPALSWITPEGEAKTQSGAIVELPEQAGLILCRAEVTDETRDDNVSQLYEPEVKQVYALPDEAPAVRVGQSLTLMGITPPFQNAPEDIVPLDDNSFQTMNRADKVVYTFARNGKRFLTTERQVGLERLFAPDWSSKSIYEFQHTFAITRNMTGKIVITAQAYDVYGAPIPGGQTELAVTVIR